MEMDLNFDVYQFFEMEDFNNKLDSLLQEDCRLDAKIKENNLKNRYIVTFQYYDLIFILKEK